MPPENKKRVAIVRCDSHAYWYAPFLSEVDPLVLATYSDDAPTRQSVHQLKNLFHDNAIAFYRLP